MSESDQTPQIALDFSDHAATLYRRMGTAWVWAGRVGLPDRELPRRLKALIAGDAVAPPQPALLGLPPAQIARLTLSGACGEGDGRCLLTGDAEALVADVLAREPRFGGRVWRCDVAAGSSGLVVAAVPRETLAEAEAFASALGLRPLGVTASMSDFPAASGPWFGLADDCAASGQSRRRLPDGLPLCEPSGWSPAADALGPGPDRERAGSSTDPAPVTAFSADLLARRRRAWRAALSNPAGLSPLADEGILEAGMQAQPAGRAAPARVETGRRPATWRLVALSSLLAAGLGALAMLPDRAGGPPAMPEAGQSQPAPQAMSAATVMPAVDPTVPTPNGPAVAQSLFTPPVGMARPPAHLGLDRLHQPGLDARFRADAVGLADASWPAARPGLHFAPPAPATAPAPPGLADSPRPRPRPSDPRIPPRPIAERFDTLAAEDPRRTAWPRPRPTGLADLADRAALGGRTRLELAGLAPVPRPERAVPQQDRPAGASGRSPVETAPQEATTAAVVSAPPARAAPAGLDLSRVSLLGVYGSERAPKALVRMPNGRVVSVGVGDRVDGGRVEAITRDALHYQRRGNRQTLKMPAG